VIRPHQPVLLVDMGWAGPAGWAHVRRHQCGADRVFACDASTSTKAPTSQAAAAPEAASYAIPERQASAVPVVSVAPTIGAWPPQHCHARILPSIDRFGMPLQLFCSPLQACPVASVERWPERPARLPRFLCISFRYLDTRPHRHRVIAGTGRPSA
jgi:hypothetical protein